MHNYPEKAEKLFKEGYNCSQAVLGAYCEDIGMEFETAIKLSSSFGGGMGRLREVCGAVSAMFMVAGLASGYTDPADSLLKQKHYELIQLLSQKFKEENGSIICRELLGLKTQQDEPIPSPRTAEYFKKRPCIELVRCASQIIDQVLFEKI